MEDAPLLEFYAQAFGVLSNSKRLQILICLKDGEKSVSEILACKMFRGVPQSTISGHLAVLRQAGFLSMRKEGTNIYYRLSNPKALAMLDIIGELLSKRAEEVGRLAGLAGR